MSSSNRRRAEVNASRRPAAWIAIACTVAVGAVWLVMRETAKPQAAPPPAASAAPEVGRATAAQEANLAPRDVPRGEQRIEPAPPPSPTKPLTQEEAAILDRYTPEGLSRAVDEAHNALITAPPAEQAEALRRYSFMLNLIAKLDPPPEPVAPEVIERQRAYLAALPAEQARVADLPEEERATKLDEFKSAFFDDSKQPAGGGPNGTRK